MFFGNFKPVLGSPFAKINSWVTGWAGDVTNLFITIVGIGFVFCAFMVWKGDEENVPKFKKGLLWTGAALAVVVLGPSIVKWIQGIK